jgi:hypothetical protein
VPERLGFGLHYRAQSGAQASTTEQINDIQLPTTDPDKPNPAPDPAPSPEKQHPRRAAACRYEMTHAKSTRKAPDTHHNHIYATMIQECMGYKDTNDVFVLHR